MEAPEHYLTFGYTILPQVDDLTDFQPVFVQIDQQAHKEYEQHLIRSWYGFHQNPEFLFWFQKRQKWIHLVKKILGNEVYFHQSKINIKQNLESSEWPWHRDFPFWNIYDHIPTCQMLNLAVLLDDVDEHSGPLQIFAKSHLTFLDREATQSSISFQNVTNSVSADLEFSFSSDEIQFFESNFEKVTITGKAGTVFLFHPEIVHYSGPSKSKNARKLLILTFNALNNKPLQKSLRPEYLCSTHYQTI